jgi:PhnB protein
MIMLEAERTEVPTRAPYHDGSSPVVLFIYVSDVDAAIATAVEQGARILVPVADHFWGDRLGWIMDTEGHVWTVASRVEDTTEEERAARWDAILAESIS